MKPALARVAGVGAVCHAGATTQELWAGMVAAAPRPAEVLDPKMDAPVRLIYLAAGADTETDRSVEGTRPAEGRAHALARAACEQALAGSTTPSDRDRVGLVVGSCMGNSTEAERVRTGLTGAPPPQWDLYGLGPALAADLQVEGPVLNVANACAAGAYAVGLGADLIESGECDQVVVLGVESYSRVALACFNQMGALDTQRCRPFAQDRDGTVFGEGAGALVLERLPEDGPAAGDVVLASARFSCDAGHPTAPDREGVQAARALHGALADAQLDPAQVGLVVPHGTGTQLNDVVEADLFAQLWPDHGPGPAAYSAKALLGHTGGGAGALAAVVAVECLRRGEVPANCDVGDLMPGMGPFMRRGRHDLRGAALVNAYAFGGNNATLTFRVAS